MIHPFRLCVTTMIVTNEQVSASIDQTPDVIRASLKDTELFVRDVQRQIGFSVLDSVNTTVDRMKADLDGIYIYIGYLYFFG